MRCSTSCHSCTIRAPKKLVANTPVTNTITSVITTPMPGTWMPSHCSVRNAGGSSSSDWSSTSTTSLSTQIVMTSGIQMSRPVMRYFLKGPKTSRQIPESKKPGSRRAGRVCIVRSVGRAGRAGALSARRRGVGLRVRFRLGLRVRFRLGLRVRFRLDLRVGLAFARLGDRLLAAVPEVGRVPATALQLEARSAQELRERGLAAGGADAHRRLRDLLQVLVLEAAFGAAVFVDRHSYASDLRVNYTRQTRSERDVVFHVVELACGLLCRSGLWLVLGLALRAGGRLPARLSRPLAPAKHLHRVGDDLGRVAVMALLVLPLAGADAALDVDLRALLQVLAGDLRQAPEERDAVPLGRLLLLAARLVLPAIGGRDADIRHALAARQIASLGVGPEGSHQDHFVHGCHDASLFYVSPATSLRTLPSSHWPGTTLSRAMRSCASTSASRTPRTRASASRSPVVSTPVAMENVRLESWLTGAGADRMPAAAASHSAASPAQAANTARAPKFPATHPPSRPPKNTPSVCVVLYTPIATPRPCAGATRDTRDGSSASSTLNATKNASMSAASVATPDGAAPSAASTPTSSTTAPTSTGFGRLRRSTYMTAGIMRANEASTTGRYIFQ